MRLDARRLSRVLTEKYQSLPCCACMRACVQDTMTAEDGQRHSAQHAFLACVRLLCGGVRVHVCCAVAFLLVHKHQSLSAYTHTDTENYTHETPKRVESESWWLSYGADMNALDSAAWAAPLYAAACTRTRTYQTRRPAMLVLADRGRGYAGQNVTRPRASLRRFLFGVVVAVALAAACRHARAPCINMHCMRLLLASCVHTRGCYFMCACACERFVRVFI